MDKQQEQQTRSAAIDPWNAERYRAQSEYEQAELYQAQGRYEQTESLYQRVLADNERAIGPTCPPTSIPPSTLAVICLKNLAVLYENQGQDEQAESFYQRALAFSERSLGFRELEMANSLHSLAAFYKAHGQDEQAESLSQRALAEYQSTLAICERGLGPTHPTTICIRNNFTPLKNAKRERDNR